MSVAKPWERIGPGNQREIILAVDFDASGRLEANFADLLRNIPAGLEVWQTVPPSDSYTKAMSELEYLDWWSDLPRRGEAEVKAVMGYCVGSVFASELADEIERSQGRRPGLVLFDPEWPSVVSLYRDFSKAIHMMSILGDDELREVEGRVREVEQMYGEDFDLVSGCLVDLYESTGRVAFHRLGVDDDVAGELLGLFRAYVSYLAAARHLRPESGWSSAVAFTSVHSSRGAKHAASETRFPVGHEELLRDPDVAVAAARVLLPQVG